MTSLKRSLDILIRQNAKLSANMVSIVSKTNASAAAAIRSEEGSAFMPGYSADSLGTHQPHKFPQPPGQMFKRKIRHVEKPSLVIFDKDGTLICFNSMWVPWVKTVVKRLCEMTGHDGIGHDAFKVLGFCPRQGRVRHGLLAHGTMAQIRERIGALLIGHGIEEGKAAEIVNSAVRDCDTSLPERLRQIHDLQAIFAELKWNGIKIAVCTADSRIGTVSTLRMLNLENYVDFVMCGDDFGSKPKPNPHNALHICQSLGVDPKEAVMVGDTVADMHMGRLAKLGTTVGVLSGVGDSHELGIHADHIVDDVGDLMPKIFDGLFCDQPSQRQAYLIN